MRYGGVRYHGGILSKAATPPQELRERIQAIEAGDSR
jgi:hypothetical protein